LRLERHPLGRGGPTLRAWDAADGYALEHLEGDVAYAAGTRVLVANDAFGALTIGILAGRPRRALPPLTTWLDSHLDEVGLRANLARNGLAETDLEVVHATDSPGGMFDAVVLKVTRDLATIEDQLHRLRPNISAETVVLGAGMVKHVHTSTLELFERIIGPTTTSLARRKARLVHATVDPQRDPGPSPFPVRFITDDGLTVVSHAGVFSSRRLDHGTRVLLDALAADDAMPPGAHVVDLGCGNGVVGVTIAGWRPDVTVTFVDDSHAAVASSRATWAVNHADRPSTFLVGDCLDPVADASADAVIVNPPFHAQAAMTRDVALQMIADARRALRPDGQLVVVGNRHLNHHTTMRRAFGNVAVIHSTPKFVVLRSVVPN